MPAKLLAVQPYGSERVEPVEDEAQPLVILKRFFRAPEGCPVPPLAVLDPGTLVFVSVVEGIFDASGGDQGCMDIPGGNVHVDSSRIVEALLEGTRRASFSGGIVV